MTTPLRIVFMGTPDFAASILKAVAAWEGGTVAAVYAQPDRPAGRGKKLKAPATKEVARELGIPVHQPLNFKTDDAVRTLRELAPDVLVVAAYGLLLPQCVLDIPPCGAYNVHASLLPRHRGAAPIQRALMEGDAVTGVTIMRMEAGLDTGPMLLQQAVSIEPDDTAGTLFEVLAEHGARLMVGALGMVAEQRAAFIPQNDDRATHAPKISPAEERIDWGLPARVIHNRIRGLTPVPGARTILHIPGREPLPLRVEPGEALDVSSGSGTPPPTLAGMPPGTVTAFDGEALVVACGEGAYRLTRLRPAGKPGMSATDFRNGRLRDLTPPYGLLSSDESSPFPTPPDGPDRG